MNLGELFVQIGTIGNSKEVRQFAQAVKRAGDAIDKYDKQQKKAQGGANGLGTSIKGAVGAVAGIVGAVGLAYHALERLTESLVRENQQWLNLTRQSDIALSTFQKWGTIGKIVGVDNAAQQLETLNQKIFNLRLTGEGAKGFQMAGIMPTNADDVLEQLRGRISGMSNTAATYLLQQMGLDPKMITLLRMGREEWEQYLYIQKKYTLNKEQRKEIDRLNRQLEVTRIQMGYLKDRIVLALMPGFVRFTKFLASATEGIARFFKWAATTKVEMPKLAEGILKVVEAVGLLTIALMAFSAHPIIASITAIIGAIMLLADDVNHYLNGGGSVIGVIAKGLQDIDIKGFVDFPVPKWLEYMIYIIDFYKQHKGMTFLAGGPIGALASTISAGFQMNKKDRAQSRDTGFRSGMSSAARYFTNNRNQNTTINQTNYIQTDTPVNDLDSALRFWQQQAQQGT